MSRARSASLVVVLGALACASCSNKTLSGLVPDEPPTVTLTSGPVDTVSAPQSWLVDISWVGSDPDGHIDHYEYAIDPPTAKQARFAQAETAWVATHETHVVAHFHASHPDGYGPGATASEFHVFVLRAIDDRHVASPRVVRAFYAYTIAPDVWITRPMPNELLRVQVPVPFTVEWDGDDPDGAGSRRPASYRTRLLDMDDPANQAYLVDPDSLLRGGEASGWAGWTTQSGDSSSLSINDAQLVPGRSGLFAVVAVDEAGATTPYILLDRNLLQFSVEPPNAGAPRIHIFSALEDFTYSSGGFYVDPSREIPLQTTVDERLRINWDATPAAGHVAVASRWMIDGDPFDETPRSGPDDLNHWSTPGPANSGLTMPVLSTGTHRLYVEIRDDFGDRSLAIVRFETITLNPTAELLVVNDTRLEVDKFVSDPSHQVPDVYTRPWPSATELDTFLFARGGYPWRGTKNPTSGVISPPGLLAGYAFDTLGTRRGLQDAAQAVPLSVLASYRHVLWLVDTQGATYNLTQDQTIFPITTLRAMSGPGLTSTLAAYVLMGGQVWLAGGGSAYASLAQFDKRNNNLGLITVFDHPTFGELGPSRPMYDAAHVRSSLGVTTALAAPQRSPAATGGWSGHGPDGTLSAPDYSLAPAAMRFRDPGIDPIPPTRMPSQGNFYYTTNTGFGFVLDPNVIVEDFGPDPGTTRLEAALDTVYDVTSVALPSPSAPVMLYYHGRENAPFVYTGFDPWAWSHGDCQGLVDFVLGDIWKLPKSAPGARTARNVSMRTPRPVSSRRLDPRSTRP